MNDNDADTTDLRTRRRRQTRVEVGDTAIRLFSSLGVSGTTVDDIATAAGISPRTFFRYFPTKEDAAFASHDGFDAAIEALTLTRSDPAGVLTELEDMYEALFRSMGRVDSRRFFALQQLIAGEPTLRLTSIARYQDAITKLQEKIRAALPGNPSFTALLIIETAGGTVNTALETWSHTSTPSGGDLADIYASCRRMLTTLTQQTS